MTTSREEDYLEAIIHLVDRKGYARVGDLSRALNCSAATVTEMFGRLSEKGLVNYEKYGGVTLTSEGRTIGDEIIRRHNIIKGFLMFLGVDEDVAEADACMIEHSVRPMTLERLEGFIDFVKKCPEDPCWITKYREFLETGAVDLKDCVLARKEDGTAERSDTS
ncbi:MAG: metal-dependent transcriptional regulator [Candidatus Thermoplasmatota archaeon]|nr:metal-dependent transcriptional regulator [Candidatus Thermoplasmatota archaeon]